MSLRSIPVEQITPADLQRLVEDGVIENRELDYKLALPGRSDKDKKEFLADVSALANTVGGDLVYGVREERQEGKPTGIPAEIVGVEIPNWETERLRMENLIRDGLDPRVMGLRIARVQLPGSGSAVVIRVPRSVLAPHMVKYKYWSRFYRRTSAGKHPMDVAEIRQAFLQGAEPVERAEQFRRHRVQLVTSGDAPVKARGGAKAFVHVVPLAYEPWSLDLSDIHTTDVLRELGPIACGYWDQRLNFDGALNYRLADSLDAVETYAQVFRSGAVEMVDTNLLSRGASVKRIYGAALENELRAGCAKALNVIVTLGVPLPYVIFLTLAGVEGYEMCWPASEPPVYPGRPPIDRDILFVPGRVIAERGRDIDPVLKPMFDAVWNAAGYRGSMNFDEEGKWTGPRGG